MLRVLSRVPDPRDPRGVRYPLTGLLTVAVCAVLAGASSFAAITDWLHDLDDQARDQLGFGDQIADRPVFRTKGQLAIDICTDAYADGVVFDFAGGDEVYGNCTQLREFFDDRQQAYVLRVASNFMLTLNPETRMTCAKAIALLATDERRWQVRSAGAGSKGQRWYAWACCRTRDVSRAGRVHYQIMTIRGSRADIRLAASAE
ncbi:transposase family protein [Micromonospora sp. NPDC049171]|uniref:transposase family protein n=1 Tax=Micromonospora sp. NPDC049171 TaxID=3155770 RepID=UPI0033FAB6AA